MYKRIMIAGGGLIGAGLANYLNTITMLNWIGIQSANGQVPVSSFDKTIVFLWWWTPLTMNYYRREMSAG